MIKINNKKSSIDDTIKLYMFIIILVIIVTTYFGFNSTSQTQIIDFIIEWFMLPAIISAFIVLFLTGLGLKFLDDINIIFTFLGFTIVFTIFQALIKLTKLTLF